MKKVLLAILILGFNISYAQVKEPKLRKELKDEFVKSCMETATSDGDQKTYDIMKVYCDCAADKMLDKFTADQIASFNNKTEEELEKEMMPVIKDCYDKLVKDLEVIYGK